MIDVASPARRSCVTVDTRCRLCAGSTETDSGPVATQSATAAKMRRNTGGAQYTLAHSTLLRRRLSVSYPIVHVASAADVGGQQIVTQHTANWAQPWVATCWTDGYFKQGVTEHCHYPLWPYVPTLEYLTAKLVCEYVTKEMCKPCALITTLPYSKCRLNFKCVVFITQPDGRLDVRSAAKENISIYIETSVYTSFNVYSSRKPAATQEAYILECWKQTSNAWVQATESESRVGEQSRFLGHVLDIQQKLECSRRLVCCGL